MTILNSVDCNKILCNKIHSKRFSRYFLHLITTIKFSKSHAVFFLKRCQRKRQVYAIVCECEICSNQILLGRSVAVFWLSNVQNMTIKTWKNVPDSSPD